MAKDNDGEVVPFNADKEDLRDEVNRRSARAGYTTRSGESSCRSKIMIMPPNERYRKNYKKIFGHN